MRKLYSLITLFIVAASPLAFINCEWPEETRLRGIFRVHDASVQDTRISEQFLNTDLRDTTYFEMNIADPAEWGIPDGP